MATENERLVTEAKLKTSAPGIVENAQTGRRALVFPTGNVEVGDTGWVDIRSSLINGWTATTMRVRRMGNKTLLRFTGLNATAATSDNFIVIPYGYGASGARDYTFALASSVRTVWANGRSLSVSRSVNVNSAIESEVVFHIDLEPWPASLGGVKL